jgi:hypothetical protein
MMEEAEKDALVRIEYTLTMMMMMIVVMSMMMMMMMMMMICDFLSYTNNHLNIIIYSIRHLCN